MTPYDFDFVFVGIRTLMKRAKWEIIIISLQIFIIIIADFNSDFKGNDKSVPKKV